MKFISTTATAVQKIKKAAKFIAQSSDISHTKALDQAAQQAGYSDWFHVQQCIKNPNPSVVSEVPLTLVDAIQRYSDHLAALPRSPVTVNSTKGDVFHDVTIEGHRFSGKITSSMDPWILTLAPPSFLDETGVALGTASVRPTVEGASGAKSEWWICKYSASEPRLDLRSMTSAGRNALAHEFGLPIVPNEGLPDPKQIWSKFVNGNEDKLFYLSPAFGKLVEWAKTHERKARSSSKNAIHLKHWREVAIKHPSFQD